MKQYQKQNKFLFKDNENDESRTTSPYRGISSQPTRGGKYPSRGRRPDSRQRTESRGRSQYTGKQQYRRDKPTTGEYRRERDDSDSSDIEMQRARDREGRRQRTIAYYESRAESRAESRDREGAESRDREGAESRDREGGRDGYIEYRRRIKGEGEGSVEYRREGETRKEMFKEEIKEFPSISYLLFREETIEEKILPKREAKRITDINSIDLEKIISSKKEILIQPKPTLMSSSDISRLSFDINKDIERKIKQFSIHTTVFNRETELVNAQQKYEDYAKSNEIVELLSNLEELKQELKRLRKIKKSDRGPDYAKKINNTGIEIKNIKTSKEYRLYRRLRAEYEELRDSEIRRIRNQNDKKLKRGTEYNQITSIIKNNAYIRLMYFYRASVIYDTIIKQLNIDLPNLLNIVVLLGLDSIIDSSSFQFDLFRITPYSCLYTEADKILKFMMYSEGYRKTINELVNDMEGEDMKSKIVSMFKMIYIKCWEEAKNVKERELLKPNYNILVQYEYVYIQLNNWMRLTITREQYENLKYMYISDFGFNNALIALACNYYMFIEPLQYLTYEVEGVPVSSELSGKNEEHIISYTNEAIQIMRRSVPNATNIATPLQLALTTNDKKIEYYSLFEEDYLFGSLSTIDKLQVKGNIIMYPFPSCYISQYITSKVKNVVEKGRVGGYFIGLIPLVYDKCIQLPGKVVKSNLEKRKQFINISERITDIKLNSMVYFSYMKGSNKEYNPAFEYLLDDLDEFDTYYIPPKVEQPKSDDELEYSENDIMME